MRYGKGLLYVILIAMTFPLGVIVMWITKPFSRWIHWGITIGCIVCIRQIMVLGMMFYGYFLFPEASAILRHYCFGDGSDLHVQSDYIQTSPVVIKHLKRLKVGEKKRFTMKQKEDVRLSYALNPYVMERKKDKVVITQWIKFQEGARTKFGPIYLPDAIVHVFDCTPFMFYHEFEYTDKTKLQAAKPRLVDRIFMKFM
jgi:hypothetical protein